MTTIQHQLDASASAATTRADLLGLITQGFALHIDPDYLIKTYGDITVGVPLDPNAKKIGPRYAVCLSRSVDDMGRDITIWSLCTTQEKATKQEIPVLARRGPGRTTPSGPSSPRTSSGSCRSTWPSRRTSTRTRRDATPAGPGCTSR